jgi:hypothetical protein
MADRLVSMVASLPRVNSRPAERGGAADERESARSPTSLPGSTVPFWNGADLAVQHLLERGRSGNLHATLGNNLFAELK